MADKAAEVALAAAAMIGHAVYAYQQASSKQTPARQDPAAIDSGSVKAQSEQMVELHTQKERAVDAPDSQLNAAGSKRKREEVGVDAAGTRRNLLCNKGTAVKALPNARRGSCVIAPCIGGRAGRGRDGPVRPQ